MNSERPWWPSDEPDPRDGADRPEPGPRPPEYRAPADDGWQSPGGVPPMGYAQPSRWEYPPEPPKARVPWGPMLVAVICVGLLAGASGGAATWLALDGGSSNEPAMGVPSTVDSSTVTGAQAQEASSAAANPVVSTAEAVLPGVVSIGVRGQAGAMQGSGFIYDNDGHVVTNNHVVEQASDDGIRVGLANGKTVPGTVVGTSPSYDLAVVKIDPQPGVRPLALGESDSVQVGQEVVAVGSPLGLEATVTTGIISALDRPVSAGDASAASYIDALQTDASINPGNSGGPLVDLSGRVIGVNTAIATVNAGGQTSGQSGSVGLGFAIPIDQVKSTVEQIIETGSARYPVIGASVSIARGTGGAIVQNVSDPSPAQSVGLQADDRIVAVDGQPVADGVELIVQIRSHEPGDEIGLTYVRDGQRRQVNVTLDGQVG